MEKNKRRRAVALALIAFFCTAAATYVAVDWKRFGGGILAFFKGKKDDQSTALAASGSGRIAVASNAAPAPVEHPGLPATSAPPVAHAKHGGGGGGAGKKADDNLFVFGDPAAGKPDNFLVASNDAPRSGGTVGDVPLPGTGTPSASPSVSGGSDAGGGDGGFSAPNPGGSSGSGDTGLPSTTTPSAPTPTPASPTPSTPSPSTPSTPAPTPTQSGSTDTNTPSPPPDSGTPTDGTTPITPTSPISSIPEASSAAMMGLAALFVAAAAQAQRRRKQEEENS